MKTPSKASIISFVTILFVCIGECPGYYTGKTQKKYYPDGKLQVISPFNDAGQLDGIVITYYPNGKIKSEQTYKYNLLNGISKDYYESGKLLNECNFKDGQEEGVDRKYY